jgi:DNA-3-methyladenine glycosylase II
MTPDYWHDAKTALAKRDAKLRRIIRTHGDASLRTRGDAFQTLARSIVGQQISVKAAQTIWDRFAAAAGGMTPPRILALEGESMRAAGLSRGKVAYLKDLATHFDTGLIKPKRWPKMDDAAIVEDLVRVKGIGVWSAEMFLIFHLMRPDILPVTDLGLQRAMERLYNQGEALTHAEMRAIGENWRPWASVATWYLWRSLDPVAVEY